MKGEGDDGTLRGTNVPSLFQTPHFYRWDTGRPAVSSPGKGTKGLETARQRGKKQRLDFLRDFQIPHNDNSVECEMKAENSRA